MHHARRARVAVLAESAARGNVLLHDRRAESAFADAGGEDVGEKHHGGYLAVCILEAGVEGTNSTSISDGLFAE